MELTEVLLENAALGSLPSVPLKLLQLPVAEDISPRDAEFSPIDIRDIRLSFDAWDLLRSRSESAVISDSLRSCCLIAVMFGNPMDWLLPISESSPVLISEEP
jgi:hypothetical protein